MEQVTKDFYKVLGVDKEASSEEIKKAYRRLSKTLHPDINKAEDAAEKFQEIYEAYEILKDEETRKQYDEFVLTNGSGRSFYNHEFQDVFEMFFSKKRGQLKPINGENIEVLVHFTVTEVIRGEEKTLYLKKDRACIECLGSGFMTPSVSSCLDCGGVGHHAKNLSTPFGRVVTSEDCTTCSGTGKQSAIACERCAGKGLIPDDTKFVFTLPKETTNGKVAIFKGEGKTGINGGANGHLIVNLKQKEYDRFQIEYDYDVLAKVRIGLANALHGAEVMVVFPDGIENKIQVPKGARTGSRISIPGLGLFDPKRNSNGAFNIEFDVEIPPNLTEKQTREIIRILESEGGDE